MLTSTKFIKFTFQQIESQKTESLAQSNNVLLQSMRTYVTLRYYKRKLNTQSFDTTLS